MAKKYDIDYALKKDPTTDPPHYYVFFKAKDKDQLQPAFKEFTAMTLNREKRPTIRERLAQAQEQSRPNTGNRRRSRPRTGRWRDDRQGEKAGHPQPSRISSSCISLTSSARGCGWRLGRTPRRSCSTSGRAFRRPLPAWRPASICWTCAWAPPAGADPAGGLLQGQEREEIPPGIEYGSARWGTPADIAPRMDPDFFQNVLLTQTERITMSSRPKGAQVRQE